VAQDQPSFDKKQEDSQKRPKRSIRKADYYKEDLQRGNRVSGMNTARASVSGGKMQGKKY